MSNMDSPAAAPRAAAVAFLSLIHILTLPTSDLV